MIRCANDSSAGRARSTASASPPAITRMVPPSTLETLPETGVSTSAAPTARTSSSSPRIVSGATVLVSATTVPGASPATSPSSPRYAARTAASSASDTITTSARGRRLAGGVGHRDALELGGHRLGLVARPVPDGQPVPGRGHPPGHRAAHPAGADDGHPQPIGGDAHVTSHPPSTYRLVALTPRFSSRKSTASTMSAMVASRRVGVRET